MAGQTPAGHLLQLTKISSSKTGCCIVTRVEVTAQGYVTERITTEAAGSVEHLLVALQSGKFAVGRATSTHILDQETRRD